MKSVVYRVACFLIVFSVIFSHTCSASSVSEPLSSEVFSDTSAASYLLMDGDTGVVLSQRNADASVPMASTTKIMTCILALENAAVSDTVLIPKEAVGVEGSSVYLVQGESLKLEELLYALMLESANDAAVAIALHVSESLEQFASLMNEKASDLGMSGSHFVNPHGLPAEGHYSTARDLCKLMQYCMQNEAFRVFTETKSIAISAPNESKRFLSNHNKLLRMYDGCVGGKTGFTKEAGRCLVSAAEKNGKLLICTTLGDPDDWRDHISLFEYGFSQYTERTVAAAASIQVAIPVVGGKEEVVLVSNQTGFSVLLRASEVVEQKVELPAFVYAGIHEGDVLGEAILSLDGKELARLELKAESDVPKREEKMSFWEKIFQCIRLWFD